MTTQDKMLIAIRYFFIFNCFFHKIAKAIPLKEPLLCCNLQEHYLNDNRNPHHVRSPDCQGFCNRPGSSLVPRLRGLYCFSPGTESNASDWDSQGKYRFYLRNRLQQPFSLLYEYI